MGLLSYLRGRAGEEAACGFLKKKGFEILERNFHSRQGEIDIIARRGGVLHFIEVKSTGGNYEASERLGVKKYEKILKTIDFYLHKKGQDTDYQIDLLTVNGREVELSENISF